ncbi:restriction endonuclease subunit S [Serratia marcescens]|uniref:restriction endonuclease subunit S n=1 Tax=Serratia marcescens TaxID=615 RepID=UPI0018744A56|nr:restriction endonuclease subunit S [Serratia marcescens]MBE5258389.1 restriction endonuclease subunit S [Serratia marcescens]MBE5299490.1 restriction endonuclease subunit S [Serratia marcescens]MBE5305391.1 restriction endonuclease subunit S [Serratia marcescens]
MTKYKAYPEYKDSGVEWLGIVPSHWKTVSISRLFSRVKRTGYKDKELLSVYRDYGVVPKSSRDDNNNKPSEDLSPYQLVEENDLVMNKMKAWQGSIAISEYEGIVSPAYFVYQPNKIIFELAHLRYVHYLLRNPIYVTQYLSRSKGIRVNQWDLDPDEFRNIELLLPSKNEQEKIYGFLDHETAKIDKLIEKQQQLIERLKEKRQAVISHAVTKGLNPDVPMKDSGVEWLGEVPAHWAVCRLKQIIKSGTSISYGIVQPGDSLDEGIPFIQTTNVSQGNIDLDSLQKTSEKIEKNYPRSRLEGGEVILGIRASIGSAYVVPLELNGVNLSRGVARIQPGNSIASDYLVWYFKTNAVEKYWALSKQGSTFSEVSIETVRELVVCVPPKDEQYCISSRLKSSLEKIHELIIKSEMQMSFLTERRTALISAAVTGKIDVRDWVASDMHDAEEPQETTA